MAARSDRNELDAEEGKIPVFTVLKNGAILKNIFIVNKPPEEPLFTSNIRSIASFRDHEDVLVVGRHPNCHIMLTHPSISRFHLQIRSKPSLQKLCLVDLSSVHGTWVSERKLDPGMSVDLKEGDTLRIGRSSRVYRLHWIPISLAYDLENPFVSKLDVAVEEEMREEDAEREEEKEEIIQNVKFCSVDDEEIQSMDSILECINSLLPDENLDLTVKKEILSEPSSMVEEVISLTCDEEGKSPFKCVLSGSENSPHFEFDVECDNAESSLQRSEKTSEFFVNMESQSSEAEKPRKTKILNSLKEHLIESVCLPKAVKEIKMQQFQDVIDVSPDTFTSKLLPGKQEVSLEKHWSDLVNLDPASFDEKTEVEILEETEFRSMLGSDDKVKDILIAEPGKLLTERMSLPVEEAIPDTKFQNVEIVEEVTMYSLSEGEKQDKLSQEHESKLHAGMTAKSCGEQGQANDEIVQDIDNKENQTPKVAQQQKPESRLFCSHIKLEQEQGIIALKNKVKMVPIQSQFLNAMGKSRSETSGHVSSVKNINPSNSGKILNKQANPSHISGKQKRCWDMIVDAASLLNKESRKTLQLLQGLKGTRLIIPRIVIKELTSKKQQFSIFKRTSEASLVLEWIEKCMEKTKWWIHVQSLTNEEKPISLTLAAPPIGIGRSQPLSFHKSSMESVSSADEDHILDFALVYRTKHNRGQLVLLSDDATLKIKSMAEGLLCETVQEFHQSLMNPFSDRFLWANSSPRGLTWPCQDVVLRDTYCRFPLRELSNAESARGLKLIVFHNSQYWQDSTLV